MSRLSREEQQRAADFWNSRQGRDVELECGHVAKNVVSFVGMRIACWETPCLSRKRYVGMNGKTEWAPKATLRRIVREVSDEAGSRV